MQKTKTRSAFVAGFFNTISPGLGFLYVGKPIYAAALPLGLALLLTVGSWTKLVFIPLGMFVTAVVAMVALIGSIVLAVLIAKRQPVVGLTKIQRWYVYVGFVLVTFIVGDALLGNRAHLFGYETFRFSSRSMDNTLLVGDFIISDTWKYRSQPPQRGELVVFRFPGDPNIKYAKRVVGHPGDRVEIRNGVLHINGTAIDEPYVKPENNLRSSKEYVSYQVPEAGYFVLGDNRDHSNDSRYWGPVPKENIHGSIEFIWLSFDSTSGFRMDRIGQYVK